MKKTVIELFAGVGGFRIGLEKADSEFETVWANQWEPSRKAQDAYDCYVSHFGRNERHSNEDVNKVPLESIPEHSLLVGGFPCQDYSVASTGAKGIQGKKGVLWWNIYNIIKEKETPFVLLENVDRLLKSPTSQRGRDFAIILGCFKELGYSVEWRVINAAEYGFSQRRRRVFIFAYRNETKFGKSFENDSVQNIVQVSGFFQKLFKANTRAVQRHSPSNYDFDFEDVKEISDNSSYKFHNAGCMLGDHIYTEDLEADYDSEFTLLKDIIESDINEEFYLDEDLSKWKYMKGPKRIERKHRDGYKYTFSEGGIAFPDPIDRPGRTMLTSEATRNRSSHVIMDPETERLRLITPIECERLNGFPDNWTNTGMSKRFRYFCMGNALVVSLVEIMGKELSEIIENE